MANPTNTELSDLIRESLETLVSTGDDLANASSLIQKMIAIKTNYDPERFQVIVEPYGSLTGLDDEVGVEIRVKYTTEVSVAPFRATIAELRAGHVASAEDGTEAKYAPSIEQS